MYCCLLSPRYYCYYIYYYSFSNMRRNKSSIFRFTCEIVVSSSPFQTHILYVVEKNGNWWRHRDTYKTPNIKCLWTSTRLYIVMRLQQARINRRYARLHHVYESGKLTSRVCLPKEFRRRFRDGDMIKAHRIIAWPMLQNLVTKSDVRRLTYLSWIMLIILTTDIR